MKAIIILVLLSVVGVIIFPVRASIVYPGDTSLYELHEKTILLNNGVRLCYVEQGLDTQPLVILVHGFTDSWHSFEKVLPFLPADLHVVAVTLRGHGNSGKPAGGYRPEDFADDIAAFMQAKKLSAAVLVGHSMGGMIVQQFALRHPQYTHGIIIVSSDACFADNPWAPAFKGEILNMREPLDPAFVEGFQRSTLAQLVDSSFIGLCVVQSMKVPVSVWQQALTGMLDTNTGGELSKIRIPALILWGEQDAFCSFDDQQRLLRQLKNATLVVYNGAGHALHWEEPERFASDVASFVMLIQ